MIRRKCWTAAICLGVTILLGGDGLSAADPVKAQPDDAKAKMTSEGWKKISEEVFERRLGPNKVEHLGFGREGLSWAIEEMNRRLEHLRQEQESYPSEELSQVIDELTVRIAGATSELSKLDQNEAEGMSSMTEAVTGPSCSSMCYSATADAYPLPTSQGTGAVAEAKFNSACGYSGNTYAYAYARATQGTNTLIVINEDPRTGTNVTSSTASSAPGGLDCYSEAYSSVTSSDLGLYYYTILDTNYSCPPPPLNPPVVSGPSTAGFTTATCSTYTWNASVSGGTTPYSYNWYYNGTQVGTGTSYSRSVCYNTADFTIQVTATDSSSPVQSKSASRAVDVTYTPPPLNFTMSGPSTADFTAADCSTYTWSASASGGTTPYSYTWYDNGALVGTGTSYSRSVCYYDADFTIQATVTDSSSPTQSRSASLPVDVTYTPPSINVTMSGPSTASFTTATCSTKTWSASVSGGTTPYSYRWYYNGSQVGTGTSYSRSVCYNTPDFTIQVNVTDSSSPVRSGSASRAVDVVYGSGGGGGGCECGCNGIICP